MHGEIGGKGLLGGARAGGGAASNARAIVGRRVFAWRVQLHRLRAPVPAKSAHFFIELQHRAAALVLSELGGL